MNRKKLLLTVGGALCAGGLIISALSFSLMGGKIEAISAAPQLSEKSYSVKAEEITQISLQSDDIKVRLIPASSDEIKVHYYQNETHLVEISSENGRLSIQASDHYKWYDSFRYGLFKDFNMLDLQVLVEVPQTSQKIDLVVDNQNASVSVRDLSFGRFDCKTSNTTILAENVSAEQFSAASSNGSVKLSSVQSEGPLNVRTSNSTIRLSDVRAQDATLQNSNGGISVQDTSLHSLNASTSNSKLSFARVTSSQGVVATNSNGGIQFDQIVSPDLTFRTSNSKISGSVVGRQSDYGILAKTTNGSCNLQDSIAPADKILRANNTNGNIHITFTEQ